MNDVSLRCAQAIELAHRQALLAARCQHELDTLRRRAAAVAPSDELRAEVTQLRLELDAITVELERLRRRTEVKVGQLLRRPVTRRPGSDGPVVSAPVVPLQQEERATVHRVTPPVPSPALRAVVVVRNRRWGLERLLNWLERQRVVAVELVDDATADPATLELLGRLPYAVHRTEQPFGILAPWALGVMGRLLANGPVIVADGDAVPGETCPDDAMERMLHELDRRPEVDVIGLSPESAAGLARTSAGIWLVRAGAFSLPREVPPLAAPYSFAWASAHIDPDDPAERFARHHDGVSDDLSRPRVPDTSGQGRGGT